MTRRRGWLCWTLLLALTFDGGVLSAWVAPATAVESPAEAGRGAHAERAIDGQGDDDDDDEGDDDEGDDDGSERTDGFRPLQAVLWLEPGSSIAEFNQEHGTTLLAAEAARDLYLIGLTGVECDDEDEAIDAIEEDDAVARIELNYTNQAPEGRPRRFFVSGEPAKRRAQRSYAPRLLGLAAAHACSDGQGVVVAVIDTGVDADHPDLRDRIAPGGVNILQPAESFADVGDGRDNDRDGAVDEMNGHGTHVAGIVAATAPNARIVPIKALNSDGVGNSFYLAQAIYYAVDRQVDLVNLSLGSTYDAKVVEDAIEEAISAGIVVVAAAGNENARGVEFPAAYEGVYAIAATTAEDRKSGFSNFAPAIDLSAPGSKITGAFPGGRRRAWSGTSMAVPWVTGASAPLMGGGMTPADAMDQLAETAVELYPNSDRFAGELGAGRVDVAAAVACDP